MLLFNYSLFEIGFKMRKKLVGPLVQYEPPKKLEKKSSRGKIFNFFGDSNFFPLKLFSLTLFQRDFLNIKLPIDK